MATEVKDRSEGLSPLNIKSFLQPIVEYVRTFVQRQMTDESIFDSDLVADPIDMAMRARFMARKPKNTDQNRWETIFAELRDGTILIPTPDLESSNPNGLTVEEHQALRTYLHESKLSRRPRR